MRLDYTVYADNIAKVSEYSKRKIVQFRRLRGGSMKLLKSTKNLNRFGLLAFMAVGVGLIVSTIINDDNLYKTEILILLSAFYLMSLWDHYRQIPEKDVAGLFSNANIQMMICALAGTTATWFINHEIGYGSIIANGLVGIVAASILPEKLAGITYTSSLVGMSSLSVLPTIWSAILAGFIIGLIFLFTSDIYAGIGGKGGTTASIAAIVTKTIVKFFL